MGNRPSKGEKENPVKKNILSIFSKYPPRAYALKKWRKLLDFKKALKNSKVLSADVTFAFDPNFPDATEDLNIAKLSHGVSLTKYTGAGGESRSNDADAKYLSKLRLAFDKEGVIFQTGELGKIDQGGGETIAYILTEYGIDVVDC